ncbi:MAG: flagellar type III secretion system pore protein FliP [Phycisphaerae bacterium]
MATHANIFGRARRVCVAALLLACVQVAAAQVVPLPDAQTSPAGLSAAPLYVPDLSKMLPQANDRQSISSTMQILVLMTVLTIAPSIILMMTSFVRMVVVLVLLRQALGTQTVPPSQVIIGLALFMTLLVMAPRFETIHREAIEPYLSGKMEQSDALSIAGGHMRTFMFDQIENAGNERDVYMMYEYAAQREVPLDETITREQVPMTALIPAFLLSELKTAFVIGFRIYLPFLVIDMVISTVLVAMGMMMLPPVLISLPFKLLLFVLADGWHLVGGSLMASVV